MRPILFYRDYMKQRRYSMAAASAVAEQAAADLEAFLAEQPSTISVCNVEHDPAYQMKDIDLLWTRSLPDKSLKTCTIEVKGDRYHQTGNYFFETVSNEGKNTPGCFLYTQADYIFYYFVAERELHILPMPATRTWFLKHLTSFRERRTSTPVGKGAAYVTVGRLIPRNVVKAAVPGVRIIKL